MARKKRMKDLSSLILFEFSPLEVESVKIAYDMCSPLLKSGHKLVITKNRINEWNFHSFRLDKEIGHYSYASYVCELKSNGTLAVISIGNFN